MKNALFATLCAGCLLVSGLAKAQDFELPPLDMPRGEAPVESQTLPPLEYEPDTSVPAIEDDPDSAYSEPDAGVAEPAPPSTEAPPAEGVPAPAAPIERQKNKVAEFSGIDKITGRITSFDVAIDETVQFGALQVTPRVCYSSPANVPPKTDSFVEVDEITLERETRRIFTGWMFADSPGLNAVEHPIYDVWLKGCKPTPSDAAPAG